MPTNEYLEQVNRLREIFPRGRFEQDVDGTAIIIPRAKRFEGHHIYEQSPYKSVGLFYIGHFDRIAKHLAPFTIKILRGDGEGILHLRWTPILAELPMLKTFSLGLQRGPEGTLFVSARDGSPCPLVG
jgi:hypothetical protein